MIYETKADMLRALQERLEDALPPGLDVRGWEASISVTGTWSAYRFYLREYPLSATQGLALLSGTLEHSEPGGGYMADHARISPITHEQQLLERRVRVDPGGRYGYSGDLYHELGYGSERDPSRAVPLIMQAWRDPVAYREGERVFYWSGTNPSWEDLDQHEPFLREMGGERLDEDVCDLGAFFEYAFRVYRFTTQAYDFCFVLCVLPIVRPLFRLVEEGLWLEPRAQLQRLRRAVELYETLTRTIYPGEMP